MGTAFRSGLAAGVAALAVSAIAVPPPVPAAAPTALVRSSEARTAPRIDLAASVRTLVTTPPNPAHFAAAKAAISRLAPEASAAVEAQAVAAPVALDSASDAIVSGYQFIQSWVTYGVQLADYALGFVPFGYVIANQVNIFYYNLIVPISDSIVYGLVVPVVDDPLNPAAYVNGLITVGQASVNAVVNTAVAEFDNFFGWLIPPLPPLPLTAARSTATLDVMPAARRAVETTTQVVPDAAEATETSSQPTTTKPSPTEAPTPIVEPTATKDSTSPTAAPETETETEPTKTPKPTTDSAGGVQAQGEVRGGTTTTVTTSTTGTTGTTGATTRHDDAGPSTTTGTTPATADAPPSSAGEAPQRDTGTDKTADAS